MQIIIMCIINILFDNTLKILDGIRKPAAPACHPKIAQNRKPFLLQTYWRNIG